MQSVSFGIHRNCPGRQANCHNLGWKNPSGNQNDLEITYAFYLKKHLGRNPGFTEVSVKNHIDSKGFWMRPVL